MKVLIAILGIVLSSGAFADDEVPGVVERVTCADMSARMTEIGAIEEPTEEETDELATLKAEYRKKCAKGARGRRASADSRVIIESDAVPEYVADEETQIEEEYEPVEQAEEVIAEEDVTEEVAEEPDPMIAIEQELANLDAGLCADGSQPNRFGCCADEIFKDLGDTVFACCPKNGEGDCFPPLK